MDQGLAAYWAASIGVGGAVLGAIAAGLFTTRAARIGGEAAERAEQRAATAEHQHWQRQQRFEAYGTFLQAAEEVLLWRPGLLDDAAFRDTFVRITRAQVRVGIIGPAEAHAAASRVMSHLIAAVDDPATLLRAVNQTPAPDLVLRFVWTTELGREFTVAYSQFSSTVRTILARPPA